MGKSRRTRTERTDASSVYQNFGNTAYGPWEPAVPYAKDILGRAVAKYRLGEFEPSYDPSKYTTAALNRAEGFDRSRQTQQGLSGLAALQRDPGSTLASSLALNRSMSPDSQASFQQVRNLKPSGDTTAGLEKIRNVASGPQVTDKAKNTLAGLLNPSGLPDSDFYNRISQDALARVLPSTTAAFSGAGLANSSVARDSVGRAAGEAVASAIAPYEYDRIHRDRDRALSAARLAPELDQASYQPGQALYGLGRDQEAFDLNKAESLGTIGALQESFERDKITDLERLGAGNESFEQNKIQNLLDAGRRQEELEERIILGGLELGKDRENVQTQRELAGLEALNNYGQFVSSAAGFGATERFGEAGVDAAIQNILEKEISTDGSGGALGGIVQALGGGETGILLAGLLQGAINNKIIDDFGSAGLPGDSTLPTLPGIPGGVGVTPGIPGISGTNYTGDPRDPIGSEILNNILNGPGNNPTNNGIPPGGFLPGRPSTGDGVQSGFDNEVLKSLIGNALSPDSPNGQSVSQEEGRQIYDLALRSGASAEEISRLTGLAGIPIGVDEINEYIRASGFA